MADTAAGKNDDGTGIPAAKPTETAAAAPDTAELGAASPAPDPGKSDGPAADTATPTSGTPSAASPTGTPPPPGPTVVVAGAAPVRPQVVAKNDDEKPNKDRDWLDVDAGTKPGPVGPDVQKNDYSQTEIGKAIRAAILNSTFSIGGYLLGGCIAKLGGLAMGALGRCENGIGHALNAFGKTEEAKKFFALGRANVADGKALRSEAFSLDPTKTTNPWLKDYFKNDGAGFLLAQQKIADGKNKKPDETITSDPHAAALAADVSPQKPSSSLAADLQKPDASSLAAGLREATADMEQPEIEQDDDEELEVTAATGGKLGPVTDGLKAESAAEGPAKPGAPEKPQAPLTGLGPAGAGDADAPPGPSAAAQAVAAARLEDKKDHAAGPDVKAAKPGGGHKPGP